MIKAKVNDKWEFDIDDHYSANIDIIEENGAWLVKKGTKVYRAYLVDSEANEKQFQFVINGNEYQVALKDKNDLLLEKMGMSNLSEQKLNHVKAPMPGKVLRIEVEPGQAIEKGQTIMVLEAMKMENSLKAAGNGTVKSVLIKAEEAVEKNQLLVEME